MKKLLGVLLALGLLCGYWVYDNTKPTPKQVAYAGIFDPGSLAIASAIYTSTVGTLPASPSVGWVRYITDGNSASDCIVGGGSNFVTCIYNGSNWVTLGGVASEADTLDTVFDRGKTIDGANSLANAFCVGDGTRMVCSYGDATLGPVVRGQVSGNDVDSAWRCWTNLDCIIYDVEGTKNFAVIDPDALGAGSGTFTMQTSEQFVASNLGIEFAESDTNPMCSSNNYNIYADTSEATLKVCNNGTASVLDPAKGPTIVRKTAQESISSTTLQNDDHLFFSVTTNSYYIFEMVVTYNTATTTDMQVTFTLPANTTGRYNIDRPGSSATSCVNNHTSNGQTLTTTVNGIGGIGAVCDIFIKGYVATTDTAGTVQFQWAAHLAAAAISVEADSYLKWQKL